MTIKEKYKQVLDELAERFSNITGKQGEWTSDYTIWVTEFEGWTTEDMLYIVSEYPKLISRYNPPVKDGFVEVMKLEMLRDDIEAWIDYNVEVASLGINYINLKSWLAGCPRLSQAEIDDIKERKRKLNDLLNGCIDIFGKLDTDPQPKHLRELKNKL